MQKVTSVSTLVPSRSNNAVVLLSKVSKRSSVVSRRRFGTHVGVSRKTDTLHVAQTQGAELQKLKGVSFGGAGIFFWWELGCVLWLLENVDVDSCPCYGASGGALAATLTACKVDPFKAFEVADRLAEEYRIFERPLGLAGIWGALIREWLDELLPENAAEICNDRVGLVITTLPKLELKLINEFESKDTLIDANLASCHIPLFLDWKLFTNFKGVDCFDGSFQDFLSGENSDLLTCDGRHLNFDYFHDKRLNNKRMDFIALKTPSEVMKMIHLGYDYTEGLSKTQAFQDALLEKIQHSETTPYQILNSSNTAFNIQSLFRCFLESNPTRKDIICLFNQFLEQK
eukprot:g7100.t1